MQMTNETSQQQQDQEMILLLLQWQTLKRERPVNELQTNFIIERQMNDFDFLQAYRISQTYRVPLSKTIIPHYIYDRRPDSQDKRCESCWGQMLNSLDGLHRCHICIPCLICSKRVDSHGNFQFVFHYCPRDLIPKLKSTDGVLDIDKLWKVQQRYKLARYNCCHRHCSIIHGKHLDLTKIEKRHLLFYEVWKSWLCEYNYLYFIPEEVVYDILDLLQMINIK